MARVFLMAFDTPELGVLIKQLRNAGHRLVVIEPKYPRFYELLKQQTQPPELFLADCQRLPSHARESCNFIQSLKAYRGAKFLLFNVKAEDEAKVQQKVPGAMTLLGEELLPAIDKLLPASRPPAPA